MTIENCAICGKTATISKDWYNRPFVRSGCDDLNVGPACRDEETAIRYWNAMQRGLKMEVEK